MSAVTIFVNNYFHELYSTHTWICNNETYTIPKAFIYFHMYPVVCPTATTLHTYIHIHMYPVVYLHRWHTVYPYLYPYLYVPGGLSAQSPHGVPISIIYTRWSIPQPPQSVPISVSISAYTQRSVSVVPHGVPISISICTWWSVRTVVTRCTHYHIHIITHCAL